MTKKKNSILRTAAGIVFAMILLFGTALPGFADSFSAGQDASDPATAAITKVFKLPVNTTTPAATFTFKITPVGVGDETDNVTIGKMPALGSNGYATVSFLLNETETFTDSGTRYFVAQTDDILAGINANGSDWKAGPGIYKYTIEEVSGGITSNAGPNDTEFTNYSEALYDLEVWVDEDEYGVLFARYIVGFYVPGTPDEYYPEEPGDGKLDPTPGTIVPGTPEEIGQNYSSLIFTNRYWKTSGTPGTDPDLNGLAVKKLVVSNNPDPNASFEFKVTVTTPAAVGDPGKTYEAFIVDKDDVIVTGSGSIFTSGTEKSIWLKQDERLVFFELEVGAEVQVYEVIVQGTRVKYSHSFGPNANTEYLMPVNQQGDWGFPLGKDDAGPHYTMEGAGANIATFTNSMSGNPPTGINMDILPYIIIIALVAGGLTAYIVVRSRQSQSAKYDA